MGQGQGVSRRSSQQPSTDAARYLMVRAFRVVPRIRIFLLSREYQETTHYGLHTESPPTLIVKRREVRVKAK